MHIVLINGHPQSGKSTFVELVKKNFSDIYEISTVDFVKAIAEECGWDGVKTEAARDFLAGLKDLLTNAPWGDVPFNKICDYVEMVRFSYKMSQDDSTNTVVFVHVREPENIEKLRSRFCESDHVVTLYVERDVLKHIVHGNHNDNGVENYDYDIRITNNTTMDDLEQMAIKFGTELRGH